MQTTLAKAARRWGDGAPLHAGARVRCLAQWHGKLGGRGGGEISFFNQLCPPYPSFTQTEM